MHRININIWRCLFASFVQGHSGRFQLQHVQPCVRYGFRKRERERERRTVFVCRCCLTVPREGPLGLQANLASLTCPPCNVVPRAPDRFCRWWLACISDSFKLSYFTPLPLYVPLQPDVEQTTRRQASVILFFLTSHRSFSFPPCETRTATGSFNACIVAFIYFLAAQSVIFGSRSDGLALCCDLHWQLISRSVRADSFVIPPFKF
jgi:hypothetical protein